MTHLQRTCHEWIWDKINIIYNILHPSLLLYIPHKATCNAILLMVQEIKSDIIYRRMNLPQSAQQITHPQRLVTHLDSSIRRLRLYLQYIGIVKYRKPMEALQRWHEINLKWINIMNLNHALTPMYHDNSYLSRANTAQTDHTLHTQQLHRTHICSHVMHTMKI